MLACAHQHVCPFLYAGAFGAHPGQGGTAGAAAGVYDGVPCQPLHAAFE
jgi:hypothetical protein